MDTRLRYFTSLPTEPFHLSIAMLRNCWHSRMEFTFRRDGRLCLRGIGQEREFRKNLRQILSGKSEESVIRVPRPSGRAPYLLMMRALDTQSRLIPRKDNCVVVLIVDPDQRTDTAIANATRFYGLSRAEAELVRALLRDKTLVESAHHLRISINTAKTHLRSIFLKTGVSRQAELVWALLAAP